MSRTPSTTPNPGEPNRRPAGAGGPGQPAQKPNVTTPMAPPVGQSAPPSRSGVPADRAHSGAPGTPVRPQTQPGGNGNRPPGTPGAPASATPGGAARGPGAPQPAPATTATPGLPPIDQLQGRPIGRVLTKMGKINRDQLVEALSFQKSKGGALGRILIDLGYIKETDLNVALAAQRGYELVALDGLKIPEEAIKAVPQQIAQTHKVLPIEYDAASRKLVVAMASHENFRALDDLRQLMGFSV